MKGRNRIELTIRNFIPHMRGQTYLKPAADNEIIAPLCESCWLIIRRELKLKHVETVHSEMRLVFALH